MTTAAATKALLDFNPTVGMVVEGAPPDDPDTDPWRVTMVFAPGFAGPPQHIHPLPQEIPLGLQALARHWLDHR